MVMLAEEQRVRDEEILGDLEPSSALAWHAQPCDRCGHPSLLSGAAPDHPCDDEKCFCDCWGENDDEITT